MKEVGIISLYHKNSNYGGLLQAYALQKIVNDFDGVNAEQIAFDTQGEMGDLCRWSNKRFDFSKFKGKNALFRGARSKALRFTDRTLEKKEDNVKKLISERIRIMDVFEESIPHSEVVNNGNISEKIEKKYDMFIAGSDQIWNPDYVHSAYMLDFTNKRKISYAASIGTDNLLPNEKEYFRKYLSDFYAISVREKKAVEILKKDIVLEKPVHDVIDPTLLLSKEQWESAAIPYNIDSPYLFTYFLGNSRRQRMAAKKYAKIHNLKIVSFPHILGQFKLVDKNFGDIQIYDASPLQFIYLIKQANCVFTDSFHACVFSIMFDKAFKVFEREEYGKSLGMSSRINTLLELFGIDNRHNTNDLSLTRTRNDIIDYSNYNLEKYKSIEFLKSSIF